MKSFWLIVGGSVAFIALLFALWFGGLIFQRETANFRGDVAVKNQTRANANFRIQAYDHFFDQCAAVQNTEGQIASLNDEIVNKDTTLERRQQIRSFLSALTASRRSLINDYNVDARKSYTTGQFLANNLPYQLDPTQENTKCVR